MSDDAARFASKPTNAATGSPTIPIAALDPCRGRRGGEWMNDLRLADVRCKTTPCVARPRKARRTSSIGTPSRLATRPNSECARRQQRLHISVVDRCLDVGSHFSSLTRNGGRRTLDQLGSRQDLMRIGWAVILRRRDSFRRSGAVPSRTSVTWNPSSMPMRAVARGRCWRAGLCTTLRRPLVSPGVIWLFMYGLRSSAGHARGGAD